MSFEMLVYQGVQDIRHIDVMRDALCLADRTELVACVAFGVEAGAKVFVDTLEPEVSHSMVTLGIRNGVTSVQAIKVLLGAGVHVRVADTGSPSMLFHPKFYLARSPQIANLIIGSANLTLSGLGNQLEASALIRFDLDAPDQLRKFRDVSTQVADLELRFPDHVYPVLTEDEADDLCAQGLVVDESLIALDSLLIDPRQSDQVHAPIRRMRSAVSQLLHRRTSRRGPSYGVVRRPVDIYDEPTSHYEEVWSMAGLTERDLSIPRNDGTHITAEINLDKGLLEDEIDFRHYFRDEVFSDIEWTPGRGTREVGVARFRVIIHGIDHGTFSLQVSHSTNFDSVTYHQRNAMTSLKWGELLPIIQDTRLLGCDLRLMRSLKSTGEFLIDIS